MVNKVRKDKITIGLPTTSVYEKVIRNIDSICKLKCNSCRQHGLNFAMPKRNVNAKKCIFSIEGQSLVRADAYWPTDLGLYCIQGNAAEMTATEGVAMGGSFRHWASQSYNDKKQYYTEAELWLGFRYTVTIQ